MERARVAILISGRGSNMAALLFAAKAEDCPYEVVLVSGDRPAAPGLDLAEAEAISVLRLDAKKLGSTYWTELKNALDAAEVDLVALAGFMRIIPPEFVAHFDGRMVNIHPSLLPRHKGLRPQRAALEAGDAIAGATVHFVTADVDAGAIIDRVEVAVMEGDDEMRLSDRLLIAEHQLYPRALARLAAQPFDAGWIESRVDGIASTLDEVFRKDSHGSPGWGVGTEKSGKLFAVIADRHHGEDAVGLLVKGAAPDEMTGLIEAHPDIYYWPKYYGASGWLGIKLNRRDVDWDMVAEWLERSWTAVAPARLVKLRRIANEF